MERLTAGDPVRLYILAFLACVTVLGSGFIMKPQSACAQTARPTELVPGTGCDKHYWDALGWRAHMEGKHDHELAQVIIAKQHSVIEVSCFPNSLQALGRAANNMFSDNLDSKLLWTGKDFKAEDDYEPTINVGSHSYTDILGGSESVGYKLLSRTRMDQVLLEAITFSLEYYLPNNFTRPNVLGPVQTAANGLCDTMNRMWNASRCSTYDKNNFYTFNELLNFEPRREIWGCVSVTAGPSIPRLFWDLAINGRPSPVPPHPYIAGAFPRPAIPANSSDPSMGGMDAVQLYLGAMYPSAPYNTLGCSAQQPIYTGIKVERSIANGPGTERFDDAICLGFGCRYNYTTRQCVGN
jgi:hypothetical protein